VTVTLTYAAGPEVTLTATTDANGAARVTPATTAGLTTVTVRDRFGNGSSVALP
jgi:hypothetical protein